MGAEHRVSVSINVIIMISAWYQPLLSIAGFISIRESFLMSSGALLDYPDLFCLPLAITTLSFYSSAIKFYSMVLDVLNFRSTSSVTNSINECDSSIDENNKKITTQSSSDVY